MNLVTLIRHELSNRGFDPDEWAGSHHGTTLPVVVQMLTGELPPVASVLLDLTETTGISPELLAA